MTLAGKLTRCAISIWRIAYQAEKGILTKKDYGKQVIFVYNQVRQLPKMY
jgi:hypothetical protein